MQRGNGLVALFVGGGGWGGGTTCLMFSCCRRQFEAQGAHKLERSLYRVIQAIRHLSK